MKRGWLGVLPILLINFVSAFSHYGYNRFSITGFFSSINPDDMILMTSFILIFAFINFSLRKVLKDSYGYPNKPVVGIISFSVSALATYGLWQTGFSIGGLFYNIGVSEEMLLFILPIILLIAAVIIIWKISFAALFLIFGLLLTLITTFTDLIYEKGISLIVGVILFLIGLWLWRRKRRGDSGYGDGGGRFGRWAGRYDPQRDIRQAKAIGRGIAATGRGVAATGRGVGRGVVATGRGIGKAYGGIKQIGDPRYKLQRYEQKIEKTKENGKKSP